MSVTANTTKKVSKGPKKGKDVIESHNSRPQDSKNKFLLSGSWRLVPLSQSGVNNLIETLYTWVDTNIDALCFEEFLKDNKLSPTTYYKWIDKHSDLKEAHQYVLMSLGIKREKGAITRKYDSSFIQQSMPIYSPAWKKVIEWRESIKKPKEDDDKRNITVIIPPFPGSDLVPNKKAKEDE